jgi:hypothetical protein
MSRQQSINTTTPAGKLDVSGYGAFAESIIR